MIVVTFTFFPPYTVSISDTRVRFCKLVFPVVTQRRMLHCDPVSHSNCTLCDPIPSVVPPASLCLPSKRLTECLVTKSSIRLLTSYSSFPTVLTSLLLTLNLRHLCRSYGIRTFIELVLLCTDPPHQSMGGFARCSSHLGRSLTTTHSLVSAVSFRPDLWRLHIQSRRFFIDAKNSRQLLYR